MNIYEELQQEAFDNNIILKEIYLKSNSDGLYKNNKIALNKGRLCNNREKACVLAEELGHHYTSCGNIINLNDIKNAKQEYRARAVAYEKLLGLNKLIEAFTVESQSKFDFIDYLGVTESFFDDAMEFYKNKYGLSVKVDEYTIIFSPYLAIFKDISKKD